MVVVNTSMLLLYPNKIMVKKIANCVANLIAFT